MLLINPVGFNVTRQSHYRYEFTSTPSGYYKFYGVREEWTGVTNKPAVRMCEIPQGGTTL